MSPLMLLFAGFYKMPRTVKELCLTEMISGQFRAIYPPATRYQMKDFETSQ